MLQGVVRLSKQTAAAAPPPAAVPSTQTASDEATDSAAVATKTGASITSSSDGSTVPTPEPAALAHAVDAVEHTTHAASLAETSPVQPAVVQLAAATGVALAGALATSAASPSPAATPTLAMSDVGRASGTSDSAVAARLVTPQVDAASPSAAALPSAAARAADSGSSDSDDDDGGVDGWTASNPIPEWRTDHTPHGYERRAPPATATATLAFSSSAALSAAVGRLSVAPWSAARRGAAAALASASKQRASVVAGLAAASSPARNADEQGPTDYSRQRTLMGALDAATPDRGALAVGSTILSTARYAAVVAAPHSAGEQSVDHVRIVSSTERARQLLNRAVQNGSTPVGTPLAAGGSIAPRTTSTSAVSAADRRAPRRTPVAPHWVGPAAAAAERDLADELGVLPVTPPKGDGAAASSPRSLPALLEDDARSDTGSEDESPRSPPRDMTPALPWSAQRRRSASGGPRRVPRDTTDAAAMRTPHFDVTGDDVDGDVPLPTPRSKVASSAARRVGPAPSSSHAMGVAPPELQTGSVITLRAVPLRPASERRLGGLAAVLTPVRRSARAHQSALLATLATAAAAAATPKTPPEMIASTTGGRAHSDGASARRSRSATRSAATPRGDRSRSGLEVEEAPRSSPPAPSALAVDVSEAGRGNSRALPHGSGTPENVFAAVSDSIAIPHRRGRPSMASRTPASLAVVYAALQRLREGAEDIGSSGSCVDKLQRHDTAFIPPTPSSAAAAAANILLSAAAVPCDSLDTKVGVVGSPSRASGLGDALLWAPNSALPGVTMHEGHAYAKH